MDGTSGSAADKPWPICPTSRWVQNISPRIAEMSRKEGNQVSVEGESLTFNERCTVFMKLRAMSDAPAERVLPKWCRHERD